jgi:hypothetical protein
LGIRQLGGDPGQKAVDFFRACGFALEPFADRTAPSKAAEYK